MKRFTETLKWRDKWFRRLKLQDKLLWGWLLDNCDAAGVIDADLDLAAQEIGLAKGKLTLSAFSERLIELPTGKHFIPKFISFQYGKISRDCRAHNPIFQSIEKHDLKGYLEGYSKGINTLQDKDKDKEEEKDKEETGVKDLCSLAQAKGHAPMIRFSEAEAEFWWHSRRKTGWTSGTAGGGAARKITSWQSDMATSLSWVKERMAKTAAGNGGVKW